MTMSFFFPQFSNVASLVIRKITLTTKIKTKSKLKLKFI
jgi:hypothetical protein